jgi:CheY-like chemotaxis protein
MEHILEAAQGAAAFTKQLTALNRRSMVIPQVVNLGRIIREFLPVLRSFVGERIRLNVQIDPLAGNLSVDPGQIQQVLMNLVLNARDAMRDGGEVHIELAPAKPDEAAIWKCPALGAGPCVSLTVRDQGTGMDAATLAHIFEPFFTTKARGKGTGLGLAVVFGIVKQQQGHISVDSTQGRGTAVQIILPCVDEPETAREPGPQMPAVPHTGTILLAEDEESVRLLLQDALKSQRYDLLVASNGEEALALASQTSGPISLLVTDVIMPHINGNGLYRQLLALRPGLKVLFMSGYPDEVISRQDIDNRTARFLAKPFALPQLLQTIESILSDGSD